MKLKTIDLCAGIGGIRRGFELAGGYRNIASAEIDEMACKTYEHLFHEDPRNDVTNEKFKKHLQTLHYDVLMAGFPCQAFSSVGLQHGFEDKTKGTICNGVQREHNKKLNNGLPILHKVPPKRDYGRYFCIMAEKGGTSHGGLTEKLSPFFHAKKQEVNAYGR